MVAGVDQLDELAAIAARYEVPIIADEVFSEFLFGHDALPRPAFTGAPLVFTLNGFSKMFGLPGMKIGWIGVSGDAHLVDRTMAALELISDTFLPVNEITQFAVPRIFSEGLSFLTRYKQWITECRNIAVDCLAGCRFASPEGGFYVTLQVPHDEEQLAIRLLNEQHILVHPGYFYDIAPDHLVMTFVHEHEALRKAFTAIAGIARE
jgi:hypothetical protein